MLNAKCPSRSNPGIQHSPFGIDPQAVYVKRLQTFKERDPLS
jgi:hypothetical protein